MVDNFYAGQYWKTGLGLKVWQLRLLNTILQDINRNTTVPLNWFISMANVETVNGLEEYDGYYAEWSAGTTSATIEIEGETLTMSGMISGKDENDKYQTLSHIFMLFGDPEDPDNSNWDELPKKLLEFKLWVHKQVENITFDPNRKRPITFLTEHLLKQDTTEVQD